MQTKAESILKPKLGDHSTDLIEYIKAIKGIRENIIENIIQEINNAENRFNIFINGKIYFILEIIKDFL